MSSAAQMVEPRSLLITRIKKIDMYLDGGTIGIQCSGYPRFNSDSRDFEICFDQRIDSKPEPEKCTLWLGYPGLEGSTPILDKPTIDHVIEKLTNHRKIVTHMIDTVLSIRSV